MGWGISSEQGWQDWSASLAPTGFTGGTITVQVSSFKDYGDLCKMYIDLQGTSASNAFTIAAPFVLSSFYAANKYKALVHVINAGANIVGRIYGSGGSATLTVDVLAGTAWSGVKGLPGIQIEFRK